MVLIVSYHENGEVRSKGTNKDGKMDGLWVSYHDNGQLRSKGTYKDGTKDGPWGLVPQKRTVKFQRNLQERQMGFRLKSTRNHKPE